MNKVLIDTNIILDFLQNRQPFIEYAVRLFEKVDSGEVEGFIAATTITNIYYIVRKAARVEAAQDAVTQILTDLHICAVKFYLWKNWKIWGKRCLIFPVWLIYKFGLRRIKAVRSFKVG